MIKLSPEVVGEIPTALVVLSKRVVPQEPNDARRVFGSRFHPAPFPVTDGAEINTEGFGSLHLGKTTRATTALKVLAEGLGCFRERLGFQSLKGDRDVWQKGSESLSVRCRMFETMT